MNSYKVRAMPCATDRQIRYYFGVVLYYWVRFDYTKKEGSQFGKTNFLQKSPLLFMNPD